MNTVGKLGSFRKPLLPNYTWFVMGLCVYCRDVYTVTSVRCCVDTSTWVYPCLARTYAPIYDVVSLKG